MQDKHNLIVKDAVIVGSGGAGLTAAIVAAKFGLDVLLIEKTEWFGGATAMSGGGTWVPANRLAREAGIIDSAVTARKYVEGVVPRVRKNILDAFLEAAPAMVDFMTSETELAFSVVPFAADYHPNVEGFGQEGRMLAPVAYDGRKLGTHFQTLRPPLPEFNAPGGMMIDLSDMQHVLAPFASFRSFSHVAAMVARTLRDRLTHARGTRLTMGNALAGRLLRSAVDAGVEMWRNTAMTELVRENGVVSAIDIMREGCAMRIHVRRGVVLATGGFARNLQMRAQHIPYPEHHRSLMPPGNTGDGLQAALAVGAVLDSGNAQNAAYTLLSLYPQRDGSTRKWPHLFLDRPKPGFMIVNKQGERFGDEASLDFVQSMHLNGAVPAFLVCDDRAIRRYGMGAVLPGGWRLRSLVKAGYVIKAPTLRALAERIGVDPEGLARSAARMTGFAIAGEDTDFGKGGNDFDRALGDFTHRPNPCLGPIETAPFYAVKVIPGDATTTLGLQVNERAQVLDAQGSPIPGLYACGLDMNSLWRGIAPGNGANNTLSLTFGFIAGREIAGRNTVAVEAMAMG